MPALASSSPRTTSATICTRVQFAAENCPAGSVYGTAVAYTPLFDEPLRGNVYLRSSTNTPARPGRLPAQRRGPHRPRGQDRPGQAGGIRALFDNLPDAPIERFAMTLDGGKRGLLVNSANICKVPPLATVRALGQNNLGAVFTTELRGQCEGKHRSDGDHTRRRAAMSDGVRRAWLGALCAAVVALVRSPRRPGRLDDPLFVFVPRRPDTRRRPAPLAPPPTGYFNGPCGLAVDSAGRFYVSDYYHHAIDVFTSAARLRDPASPDVDPLDGPCGLALDGADNLYVNDYHRSVVEVTAPLRLRHRCRLRRRLRLEHHPPASRSTPPAATSTSTTAPTSPSMTRPGTRCSTAPAR